LKPYNKEELESMVMELAQADHAIYQVICNRISMDAKWCKLFVHGLDLNTTKQSLARAFQQFGAVKEAIVLLEQHDRSKGCGFVIFESAMAARQAMSMAVLVDGRQVQCDYAFKGNPKKVFINQPVISPEQRLAADGRRLFIHDLAWKTTDETLRQAFLQYGEIQEAVVIHDRKTRKSKGFGFVTFLTAEAAQRALREPVKRIDDRNAKVQYAKATKDAEVPAAPYHSPSPSVGSVLSSKSSGTVPMPMSKRPSLDMNNVSNSSNVTIGSLASINSYAISPSLTGYSIANSAPPSVPMFHPSPASNTWLSSSNGFPALQCAMSNSSDRSSPSNSMQGTPVMAAVQCSNSPMVPMQNSVMQAAVLPHPSSLPPPPSPHSLGIATSLSQKQMQGAVYNVVNMGVLQQNALMMQQNQ